MSLIIESVSSFEKSFSSYAIRLGFLPSNTLMNLNQSITALICCLGSWSRLIILFINYVLFFVQPPMHRSVKLSNPLLLGRLGKNFQVPSPGKCLRPSSPLSSSRRYLLGHRLPNFKYKYIQTKLVLYKILLPCLRDESVVEKWELRVISKLLLFGKNILSSILHKWMERDSLSYLKLSALFLRDFDASIDSI